MRYLYKLGEKKYYIGGLEIVYIYLEFLEELGKWKLESSKVIIFFIIERYCIFEVKINIWNKREYFGFKSGLERSGEIKFGFSFK